MTVGIQVSSTGLRHIRSASFPAHELQQKKSFLATPPPIRLSSQRSSFYYFHATSLSTLYVSLLPLPPTSHGQLTLPPPCLTNSLPLFIQPCSHGDQAESPQTAWTRSLRGPSWPSKRPRFHNILGIWDGVIVLRMKQIKAL